MKLLSASIALLGLPAVLAAVAANLPNNDATPTRPEPAYLVPGPSALPTAPPSIPSHLRELLERIWQGKSAAEPEQGEGRQEDEIFQVQARAISSSALNEDPTHSSSSSSGKVSVMNSFTSNGSSSTASATSVSTTTVAATGGGEGTEIAVFTVAGGVYTVTSASGVEVVDYKTLNGGGQLIGGVEVATATSAVNVGGTVVGFSPLPSSSSAPAPATTSSASASGSSSAAASSTAAGAASSSSSAGGVAPRQTGGGANAVAVIGAVAGLMLL